jgi:tetratricopeptide (TPR) repeat protein
MPDTDQTALAALRTELEARAGEPETEAELRAEVDDAVAHGEYARAVEAGMRLVNLLVQAGRAEQALPLADQLPEFGRRAGSSRADMLGLRGQRPQVLVFAGRFEAALDEVERLLRRVGKDSEHWHVREVLHNIGYRAAAKLERFADALGHSEAVITSMAERGGSDVELARELLNSALAHRDAGNPDLSRVLTGRAQEIFEAAKDVEGLVAVRVALAELEAREGRPDEAVALSRDVLRLRYTTGLDGDPAAVRDAHNNVAANLSRADGDRTEGVAHLLAACIIDDLTGSWRYAETVLRLQLFAANGWEEAPATLTELAGQLTVTPDVRFLAYVATLPGGQAAAEASLEHLRPAVRHAAANLMMQIVVAAGEKFGVMDEAGNVQVIGEEDPGKSAGVVRRYLRRRR